MATFIVNHVVIEETNSLAHPTGPVEVSAKKSFLLDRGSSRTSLGLALGCVQNKSYKIILIEEEAQ
jgi:hypothetical protein